MGGQPPETNEIPARVHYRAADTLALSCGTCSFYGAGQFGRCGMFDVHVEPDRVCDEWANSGIPVVAGQADWYPNSLVAALPARPRKAAVPAEVHNRVLRRGYQRADDLEPKLARVIEPILKKAGLEAARRFRERVTDHLAASADIAAALQTGADITPQSCMVALFPRPDEAAALAHPDGEPAGLLHVTLAYLGDVDPSEAERIAGMLAPVAATHAPLEGQVGGVGAFADNGRGAPAILLPSVPGLAELRHDVTVALTRGGSDYGRGHGFVPHATVRYGDGDAPERDLIGQPLHFDTLRVVQGNRTVADHPLTGAKPLTADGSPRWSAPAPDELIDVPALAAEILKKTEPVRRAFVEAVMTPTLKAAGLSFDAKNPLAAQALAASGTHVTNIAETTRENVRKAIAVAYDEGLSIPHTADLIQAGMASASKPRATLIARTELARSANAGALASAQIVEGETGTAYAKTWMTAPGATYPRHELYQGLDGQERQLDQSFEVGDSELQYPGDPQGDISETANCRCSLSFSDRGGGEAEAPEDVPDAADE